MDAQGSGAARGRVRVCLCAAPAPAQSKRSKRRGWLRSQRSLDQWAPAADESAQAQHGARTRRARSAERFEGVRVQGEGVGVGTPTPLTLTTPSPSACSPPPSYEAAVSKSALPSYEECVRTAPSPSPAASASTCACARCKPDTGAGAARSAQSGLCPCAKCQPYGHPAYGHPANVNTAVLISLDTAMHSALADGVALCALM